MLNRLSLLQIGALSLLGMNADALTVPAVQTDKSVVLVFLAGGPTHVETFNPIPNAPTEFRSIIDSLQAKDSDIMMGGLWNNLIKHTDKINVVNSFAHRNNSHAQATHWVMTSHNTKENNSQEHPSHGSVVSRYFGSSQDNGMPTYVRQNGIYGSDASYLGAEFNPFESSRKDNLGLNIDLERFRDRQNLLTQLDKLDRNINTGPIDAYKAQAYAILLNKVKEAFDIDKEKPKTKRLYGKSSIGKEMLLARRLIENGTKFVSVSYGGWDMHRDIEKGLNNKIPPLDKALSAFLEDIDQRGMLKDTLVIITGEFGRTPKINNNAGRDHWGALSTLAFAGGDYEQGRVIGRSDTKATAPNSLPITPMDIRATVLDHMEIPSNLTYFDTFGRPQYMTTGKVIL